MSESGRVLAVSLEARADQLVQDESSSATTLHLNDVADFNETGGQARLTDDDGNVQDVVYTVASMEDDTLTLAAGLLTSFPEGTEVMPLPRKNSRMAYVQLDDPDFPAIMARIPYGMRNQLPLGMRSDELAENDLAIRSPENVLVDLVSGYWMVTDIVGTETALEDVGTEAELIEQPFTIVGDATNSTSYPQLWPIPTNMRFVRVDVCAGTPPSGGDLEMNLRVYSEDALSSVPVFATDARLIVPDGDKVAAAEIGDLDTEWLRQEVYEREKLGVRVVTANGAADIVISCVFEPIGPRDAEPLAQQRFGELDAVGDISTSGVINP